MGTIYDGHGITLSIGATTGIKLKSLTGGGFGGTKAVMDISTMSNTAYKTKLASTLREVPELVATVQLDLTQLATLRGYTGSKECKVVSGATTYVTVWCGVTGIGAPTMDTDTEATVEITLTPTNLNGSNAVTAPA